MSSNFLSYEGALENVSEWIQGAILLWECKKWQILVKDGTMVLYNAKNNITKILFPTETAHRLGISFPLIVDENIRFFPHHQSWNTYIVWIQGKVFSFDEEYLNFQELFYDMPEIEKQDIEVMYSWNAIEIKIGEVIGLKNQSSNVFSYFPKSQVSWSNLADGIKNDIETILEPWKINDTVSLESIKKSNFELDNENGRIIMQYGKEQITVAQFLPQLTRLQVQLFYIQDMLFPVINGKIFSFSPKSKEFADLFQKTPFHQGKVSVQVFQESVWEYEVLTSGNDVCIIWKDGLVQSFSCQSNENVREVIENIKLWIPSDVVVQDLVWDDILHQELNDTVRAFLDAHISNTTKLPLENAVIKSDGITTTISGNRGTVEYIYTVRSVAWKVMIDDFTLKIYVFEELMLVQEHEKVSGVEFVTLEDNGIYISTRRLWKNGTYNNFLSKVEDIVFRPKQDVDFERFWKFLKTDTLVFHTYQDKWDIRMRGVTFTEQENTMFDVLQRLLYTERAYLKQLQTAHFQRIQAASNREIFLDRETHFRQFRELEKFEKYVHELETKYETERRKMLEFHEDILEKYDVEVYHLNGTIYPMSEAWEMFFICRSKKNTWVFGWKTEVKIFQYDVKKWVALEVATIKVKKWENIQVQRSNKQRYVSPIVNKWPRPQDYDYFDIQVGFKTLADAFKIKKQSQPQERKIQEFNPTSTSWYDVWFDGKKAYLSWEVPQKFKNEFWIDMFEWKGALFISIHWVLEPMKRLVVGDIEFFMFPPKNLWVKIDREKTKVGWPTRYQDRLFYGYGFALDGTKIELWWDEKATITYKNGDREEAIFAKAA